jgi:hypothetical protein
MKRPTSLLLAAFACLGPALCIARDAQIDPESTTRVLDSDENLTATIKASRESFSECNRLFVARFLARNKKYAVAPELTFSEERCRHLTEYAADQELRSKFVRQSDKQFLRIGPAETPKVLLQIMPDDDDGAGRLSFKRGIA